MNPSSIVLLSLFGLAALAGDRPGDGFIKVSQQSMIDTAASIAAFSN